MCKAVPLSFVSTTRTEPQRSRGGDRSSISHVDEVSMLAKSVLNSGPVPSSIVALVVRIRSCATLSARASLAGRRAVSRSRNQKTTAKATRMAAAIMPKKVLRFMVSPNAKVSDGSQPTVTFHLSLSESAGSRSLHNLVLRFYFWLGGASRDSSLGTSWNQPEGLVYF